MKIHLLAIGSRMPQWVEQGYNDYAGRLNTNVKLVLKALSAEKRTKKSDISKICEKESQKLLQAIPSNNIVIALEITGQQWSTEKLAKNMENWMMSGRDVSLLVGGPEGMSKTCRDRADYLWSLSALTYPHPLVRVILAEQLYRAWAITANHPYHRAG
ncbi:MAG TPA: 23S rRNA (pseudouridine(1915)-N(3))-methyltransferase RlmH [Thiothrix sp.]|nr:23S rRNA (pseudouridine(1915)-N(3))-methyltransferase RlmH [Thiothrix sp.]